MHADSADVSSTDILKRGVSPDFGTTGSGESVLRQCGIFLLSLAAAFRVCAAPPERADGFPPVPKAAIAELKRAVGGPISKGVVFVNGRYIAPPYKVERCGNAISVNSVQVTAPLVDWNEFLRQQQGYRVETVPYPPERKMVEEDVPFEIEEEIEVEVSDDDVDDLFGDEEKKPDAAAKKNVRKIRKKVKRIEMRRQTVEKEVPSDRPPRKVVRFDGEFRHNFRVRALLAKIDGERSLIEKRLRDGWIVCYGAKYPRAEGDAAAARQVLSQLWRVEKESSTLDGFVSAAQSSGLGFLPIGVLRDLFSNRLDYPKLKSRALGQ